MSPGRKPGAASIKPSNSISAAAGRLVLNEKMSSIQALSTFLEPAGVTSTAVQAIGMTPGLAPPPGSNTTQTVEMVLELSGSFDTYDAETQASMKTAMQKRIRVRLIPTIPTVIGPIRAHLIRTAIRTLA